MHHIHSQKERKVSVWGLYLIVLRSSFYVYTKQGSLPRECFHLLRIVSPHINKPIKVISHRHAHGGNPNVDSSSLRLSSQRALCCVLLTIKASTPWKYRFFLFIGSGGYECEVFGPKEKISIAVFFCFSVGSSFFHTSPTPFLTPFQPPNTG